MWCKVPVNKNATDKTKKLLEYLVDNCGKKIITGVHTQTVPMEEREYIKEVTGYYPKLVEFEMLSYSSNINYDDALYECLKEVEENKGTIDVGVDLSLKEDIIPMICFHWFSPLYGRDKSFYSVNTSFDPDMVLIVGSDEENAFYRDLDVISEELYKFKAMDIPILFRPLHETEGTWFWWGSKGGETAKKLYIKLFDYLVNIKKLDNMLWVWSTPTKEAYPGDEYVDIIGWDIYLKEKEKTDYKFHYEQLRENTTLNKIAAISEVGYNPDIEMLEKSKVPWSFYMTWSKEFSLDGIINTKEEIKKLYASDYSIKL